MLDSLSVRLERIRIDSGAAVHIHITNTLYITKTGEIALVALLVKVMLVANKDHSKQLRPRSAHVTRHDVQHRHIHSELFSDIPPS